MKVSTIEKLTKVTPYIISAASLIFAAQFLYHTIDSSFRSVNIFWLILSIVTSILVLVGLRTEFGIVKMIEINEKDFQISGLIKSLLIITSSAMFTYFITNIFNTTTIFSASLVCILYAFLFSSYESEAFSGACAGMIGAYLCAHWSVAFVTALVTGVVFILFKPYFKGVGGRGGSIPYVGTTLVVRLLFQLKPEQSNPIESELIIPAFLLLLLTAFLSYYLHKEKLLTVVKSAMIITLIFSVIFPAHLYTLTTTVFAGAIIGMSTEDRIENYLDLLLVAIICFILYIPAFHILDGIGGKIGILCLLAYYGFIGVKYTLLNVINLKPKLMNRL